MSSGSATRVIVAGALSLVLGLALGGLAPRAENRSLRMQVDELKDRECSGNDVGREIAAAFQGEPWKAALTAAGYEFDRATPYIFISGARDVGGARGRHAGGDHAGGMLRRLARWLWGVGGGVVDARGDGIRLKTT